MKRYSRELTVAIALSALLVLLSIFAPHFFQPQPLLARLTAQVPVLVLTIGMAVVIISRQIDISVGSQFGVCAVVAGLMSAAGAPLGIALLTATLTGTAMGALNGFLVAWLGLPSIVVSLATMVTWAEVLRLFQQGRFINLPPRVQWFGFSQLVGQASLLFFALGLLGAMAYFLKNRTGDPRGVTMLAFVLMGTLTGIAAFCNMVQSPQVDPKCGVGLEMKAIAAAVVGGVAVTGGRGGLLGAFFGLLLLATINPALTYMHVDAYWEKAIQGLVILLAVIADGLRTKRSAA
ncbi:MAG: ABC transporter permease [Proteobacteria bacterium]|nr:ABC transporter permease [Pseudomonadota bacterium]